MTNETQERELIAEEGFAEFVPEPGSAMIGSVRHSQRIGNIASALAAAQLEFLPIYKENENPAFRSKYADLATVIAATQKALAKQGLVVIQSPTTKGKDLTLTSMLVHSSGEWLSSDLTMPATMRDGFTAQTIGSAVTYSRRYALQALIGVSADVDEDGNEASGVGSKQAAQAVADKKIAEHKAKRANGAKSEPVTTLFYTVPNEHNGHFAEFINIKEFGSGMDQVAAEGLKQVLKPYIARVTKADTILVSTSKMDDLLEKLAGDCGLTVKLLANPSA
jgi:phage terminase large subunit-like protein